METRIGTSETRKTASHLLWFGGAALAFSNFAAGALLTQKASLFNAPAAAPAAAFSYPVASEIRRPPFPEVDSLRYVRAAPEPPPVARPSSPQVALAPRQVPVRPATVPLAAPPIAKKVPELRKGETARKTLPNLSKTYFSDASNHFHLITSWFDDPKSGNGKSFGSHGGHPQSPAPKAVMAAAPAINPSVRSFRANAKGGNRTSFAALGRISATRSAGGSHPAEDFVSYGEAGAASGAEAPVGYSALSAASGSLYNGITSDAAGQESDKSSSSSGSSGNNSSAPTALESQTSGSDDAQFVTQTAPPSIVTVGQTYNVTVTMLNAGASTWNSASYYELGAVNPIGNMTWGMSAIWLDVGDSIGPGEQKEFSFPVTAPTTPGVFNFQWRMKKGSVFFGDRTLNVTVTVE